VAIREFLQIEIWSKTTSRKILIGFGKIFVGLAIVGVGVVAWVAISSHWITNAERNAGKAALAQVDALQRFDEMSDAEYEEGALQAKGKIAAAEQAAWTFKDRWVYINLEMCFVLTDAEKSNRRWIKEARFHRDPDREGKDRESVQKSEILRNSLRQGLHKALDE
jgi:hypothetical protein